MLSTLIYKAIKNFYFDITANNFFCNIINLILLINFILINCNLDLSKNLMITPFYYRYIVFLLTILFFGLITIIMTFFYFSENRKIKRKEKELRELTIYTNTLEGIYMELRSFKHDYVNIISSLNGYIDSDNMEGLKKYFSETITPLSTVFETNNFRIGLLNNIEIPQIKGLVSIKLIFAQNKGIDIFIDIATRIKQINMDIITLIRILGVFIDNATEEALNCINGQVIFSIIEKKNSKIIIVSNTYKTKPNLQNIFKKDFSTKGPSRGLGLYAVQSFIGNLKHVTLETELDEKFFTHILTIEN
ncbi:MAG: sensor histidine kinase [Clostridium sp.]